MNWADTVGSGWDAIRTHRLRSTLTALGILIGIAAVVLTVGFGQGAQRKVSDQLAALGGNLLIVSPGSSTTSGVRGGFGSASTLTSADASALGSKRAAPDVAAVAPVLQSAGQSLVNGATNWTTTVVGTTPSWDSVRGRHLQSGRFLTAADEQQAAAVVVLAADTASELFGRFDPVGQSVTIGSTPYQVIGVLASAGSDSTTNLDDQAIVPLSTAAQRIVGGTSRTSVQTVYVKAVSPARLTAAYQETDAILSYRHGTTAADADFTITTQQSVITTTSSVDRTLTTLLIGVAALSLLVGGIGVMNIMLVSVKERTREIGLRKALGGTPAAIRRQFLTEASMLGLTGGLLGVAVGVAAAEVLPHLISNPIAISLPWIGIAIATAITIGVGFGVYPAARAARLSPIDALRSE
ncbi:MAG: ABC transporter permease [Jatrophihabitans sp.]|uniref:ABC transporter permease n=1 Tax=Jatrophihabitans sp. TaxID=1932789 RepID=UPI003F805CEA